MDEPRKGHRIRCISMYDEQRPIPDGMFGTIDHVDDIGTIHVNWDNGRKLGIIPGFDLYEIVDQEHEQRGLL